MNPGMTEARWPALHEPGLKWLARTERAVRTLNHPEQGAFIAIANAIELQLEQGADPATMRHLISALLAFTQAAGLRAEQLKLLKDVDGNLASMQP